MLNHLSEWLRLADGPRFEIGGQERAGSGLEWPGARHLVEFRLEYGLPLWRYDIGDTTIEKSVGMPHQQNTVHVTYRLLRGESVRLKLRPALHVRPLEGSVHGAIAEPYTITAVEDRLELRRRAATRRSVSRSTAAEPPSRWTAPGSRTSTTGPRPNEAMRTRASCGAPATSAPTSARSEHDPDGLHRAVGHARALSPEAAEEVERERREGLLASAQPAARSGVGAELVLAADQFVITPSAGARMPPAPVPPAATCARSSPAITGSPTGAATR